MIYAVIDGQPYRINDEDSNRVGYGGEADVYWFNPTREFIARHGSNRYVVKIFRAARTDAQRRAQRERQTKLGSFPSGLPGNVIAPISLVSDSSDQIIGYVMVYVPDGTPLIQFKSAQYHKDHSITIGKILKVLTNLHDLVTAVHRCGIVIGDFNDKNVLVGPNFEVYLLDADSLQYGNWECPAFTPKFVDPKIVVADPANANQLKKVGEHSTLTDWYAFTVMVFQLLVRIHPYTDGFYAPDANEGVVQGVKRIHRRLSVFHPRVTLPDMATPFDRLPSGFLHCFELVFEEEKRGSFPRELLETSPPQPTTVRSQQQQPTSNLSQRYLVVDLQGQRTVYAYHESGAYRREDGRIIYPAPAHDSRLTAILAGNRTVLASRTSFAVFNGGRNSGQVQTQERFGKTTVTANSQHVYWLRHHELVRDDSLGRVITIGSVSANSTSVWVGERFGLALEDNGVLTRILTFTDQPGFSISTLPPKFGSLVDAQCVISDELAWLTLSISDGGQVVNQCYVFDSRAQLRATAEAYRGDNTWLGSMTNVAHATGSKLLAPVPGIGIARIGIAGQRAQQEITYPGTSMLVPDKGATVGLCYSHHQGVLHFSNSRITQITTTL